MVLDTTKQITFDDLLGAKLEQPYGIKIVSACEAEPVLYLYLAGAALRVCQDENGFCYFIVPETGGLPWPIIDAIEHEFDCGIQRLVDARGRAVTSVSQQEVVEFFGHDHLASADVIVSCVEGYGPELEPESELSEQVEIARVLVNRNSQLREDPQTLLLLVEDLYAQRHPPFKVTLRRRSPMVAQWLAEEMVAWASASRDQKAD